MQRRRWLIGVPVWAAWAAAWGQAAQANQALRIVVPFSAGSGTDVVARLVGKALGEVLSRHAVIDNKPGAAGTVAALAVLSEPTDGRVAMMVSSAYAVLPVSGRKLGFDPDADFEALGIVARSANVLIASKASGFRSLADLVRAGQSKAEGLSFATSGIGSGTHLNAEVFASASGIRTLHVPMRGGPEIISEIVSGRVDFAFVPPSQIAALAGDRLTPLVVTSRRRLRTLPEVPTIEESGYPGFEYHLWYGLLAKSGTPAAAIEALQQALPKAMGDAAVVSGLHAAGMEPMSLVGPAARAYLRAEIERIRQLVNSRGLKLQE